MEYPYAKLQHLVNKYPITDSVLRLNLQEFSRRQINIISIILEHRALESRNLHLYKLNLGQVQTILQQVHTHLNLPYDLVEGAGNVFDTTDKQLLKIKSMLEQIIAKLTINDSYCLIC